jgi:hypothetical protein
VVADRGICENENCPGPITASPSGARSLASAGRENVVPPSVETRTDVRSPPGRAESLQQRREIR